ncbi:membrane-associating domain-containing protein [Xylariomycetidae sp. FL2044]|nr:membrane-associating domain-containing protein [Xylariomycetidae sp. FL2044]
MILTDIFAMVLRIAELAFAAIVAGINGDTLHDARGQSSWELGRFIYTEVVAGIAIFLSLIWLFPFSGSFVHWPVDIIISICWFVAFGLLVDQLNGACGDIFEWGNIAFHDDNPCGQWKAVIAFAFLSAICWLVSGIIGLIWVRDHETRAYRRRTWRGSRV